MPRTEAQPVWAQVHYPNSTVSVNAGACGGTVLSKTGFSCFTMVERESPPFLEPRRGPTPDENCNGNNFGASFGVLEGRFRIGFTVFADC
jgi:hypothetical protein